MKGILKRYYAAGWVVEYQHQLTISCTQRKELQVHPDDLDSVFNVGVEVDFYIVEVEKMSGTVQYAKLITESHSDQVIDIMNDEKSLEISDEEIENAYAQAMIKENGSDYIGMNEEIDAEIYYNKTFKKD